MKRILAALSAALVLALTPALGANAAEITPDPQIAAVMAELPGGQLIDSHHATWPALGMEMTVPGTGVAPLTVGGCATGSVCAFGSLAATGAKLSWTTCGNPSIPSSFTVRSIADARSSGYLQARNGTTVVATANAGSWTNVYATTTNVRCVS